MGAQSRLEARESRIGELEEECGREFRTRVELEGNI